MIGWKPNVISTRSSDESRAKGERLVASPSRLSHADAAWLCFTPPCPQPAWIDRASRVEQLD
jgi:hypothetical protein